MAYPTNCVEALALLKTKHEEAQGYQDTAVHYINEAYTELQLGHDHTAIGSLIQAVTMNNYMIMGMFLIEGEGDEESFWWWYLTNCIKAGNDFTLMTFIDAFINAEDDWRSAHRLLLDAYQASMYDKPFDMEYHKNWVQRFKEWR